MNISAANLLKKSLSQNVFLNKKKNKKATIVTKNMIEGNKYAEEKNKGLCQELRGTIVNEEHNYNLFFTLDAVKNNIGIETKQIIGKYESWFFESSLLQSALYYSLLDEVMYLETPNFRLKEGFNQQFLDLVENPITKFELHFGEKKYNIELLTNDVKNFYFEKAKKLIEYVNLPWNQAMYYSKKFDNLYKWKEYKLLKASFKYKKIN